MSAHRAESPALASLIEQLCTLPGIGRKSAQRITYHLLQQNRNDMEQLAIALNTAKSNIKKCKRCRFFTEQELCLVCSDQKREQKQLCIVESPADVPVFEETGYRGLYFVLLGRLSPLDGIGPAELGLQTLPELVKQYGIEEVILATNSTVEGNVTAQYICELLQPHCTNITRLAQGIPAGGELEYLDSNTLSLALRDRHSL
ncbi:MAG: recombination mediator RecR [Candidatus Porifericomitaceae bacterium WSBS_2022_MAG_OTU9]